MEIQEATHADIDGLADLLNLLFTQEAEFKPDGEMQKKGLRLIVENPEIGRILIFRVENRIVGMVNLLFTVSTALGGRVALLEDMIVHPDFRGKGIGEQLLQAAIDKAKTTGCLRITLLTDADNKSAQRFYQRHGFQLSSMIPLRMHLE